MISGKYNIIADDVYIADDVVIGDYCKIGHGCKIGKGTVIKSYVELRENTVIGENCYIDSGVKSSGDVTICDDVTVRYDAIIARDVIIGSHAFIAPQVMTIYSDRKGVKHPGTYIGDHTFIGTNVTIGPNVKIADGDEDKKVVIGTKAFVRCDITTPGTYVGVPARRKVGYTNPDTLRGWNCRLCGIPLTHSNSACPISTTCKDCRDVSMDVEKKQNDAGIITVTCECGRTYKFDRASGERKFI